MGLPRFTGLLRWSALGVLLLSVAAAAEPLTVDVRDAQAGYDPRTGQPVLAIRMGDAAAAFSRLTRDGVGRSMELRIDGKAVATSVVREPILGGTLQSAARTTKPIVRLPCG